ncbi:hypothetical protein A2U01_0052796, partial [Trifolium medium]|nr:hypothetical protein [Trifolium medium]
MLRVDGSSRSSCLLFRWFWCFLRSWCSAPLIDHPSIWILIGLKKPYRLLLAAGSSGYVDRLRVD